MNKTTCNFKKSNINNLLKDPIMKTISNTAIDSVFSLSDRPHLSSSAMIISNNVNRPWKNIPTLVTTIAMAFACLNNVAATSLTIEQSAIPGKKVMERDSAIVVTRGILDGEFPVTVSTIVTSVSPKEFVINEYGEGNKITALMEQLTGFVTERGENGVAVPLLVNMGWDLLVVVTADDGMHIKTFQTPISSSNGLSDVEEMVGTTLPQFLDLPDPQSYFEMVTRRNEQKISDPEDIDSTKKVISDAEIVQPMAITDKISFGYALGSYNGVVAYSNYGNELTTKWGTNSVNGYITGYKWHCVEFVNRYFWLKRGKKISGGNANTYYGNAAVKGLKRAANGGMNPPMPGNIICSNGGSYGHCAIVSEVSLVNGGYVKTIQQNWTNSAADAAKKLPLSVTKKNGVSYYSVGGFNSTYPVVGWMW